MRKVQRTFRSKDESNAPSPKQPICRGPDLLLQHSNDMNPIQSHLPNTHKIDEDVIWIGSTSDIRALGFWIKIANPKISTVVKDKLSRRLPDLIG